MTAYNAPTLVDGGVITKDMLEEPMAVIEEVDSTRRMYLKRGVSTSTLTLSTTPTAASGSQIYVQARGNNAIAFVSITADLYVPSTAVGYARMQLYVDSSAVGVYAEKYMGHTDRCTLGLGQGITLTHGEHSLDIYGWKTVAGGTASLQGSSTQITVIVMDLP